MSEIEKNEVQNKTKDINDILNVINKANNAFTYDVYVPSLKTNVQFKEINTSQQKRIVKTIVDSASGGSSFVRTMRTIIKENCVDNIDTDSLNILDKLFILIKMRSVSVGNTLKRDEGKTVINLDEIIEKSNTISEFEPNKEFVHEDFKLFVNIPSIKKESITETSIDTKIDIQKGLDEDDFQNIIDASYTRELLKYIDIVEIKDEENGEIIKINFNDISDVENKTKILDALPGKLTDSVTKFIEKIYKEVENIMTMKVLEDGEVKEVEIPIDGNFFMSS